MYLAGSLRKLGKIFPNLPWGRLVEVIALASILELLVTPSTAEFVSLWTQALPEVSRYVRILVPNSASVDDILQLTATRLWDKFADYDSGRPFVPWAIRFAHHEVLGWRQRQTRDRSVFSEKTIDQLHDRFCAELPLIEIRRQALDDCLQQLSDSERDLVLRRYAEHGTVQREARQSNTSVHKLYYVIDKLRRRLLDCIDGKMQLEGWSNE